MMPHKIELILFVLHRPRKPEQVGMEVYQYDITLANFANVNEPNKEVINAEPSI